MNSTLSCRPTYRITLSERVDSLSTGAKPGSGPQVSTLNQVFCVCIFSWIFNCDGTLQYYVDHKYILVCL